MLYIVFGWYLIIMMYRRKVKINKVTYSMNQYQKKAFLNKIFNKNQEKNLLN